MMHSHIYIKANPNFEHMPHGFIRMKIMHCFPPEYLIDYSYWPLSRGQARWKTRLRYKFWPHKFTCPSAPTYTTMRVKWSKPVFLQKTNIWIISRINSQLWSTVSSFCFTYPFTIQNKKKTQDRLILLKMSFYLKMTCILKFTLSENDIEFNE